MAEIHLITTCTDRKSAPIPADLRLGSVRPSRSRDRVGEWIDRLQSFDGVSLAAVDTYAGEHWSEARKASQHATSFHILSAGYGLISDDAKIHPYSATFQTGQLDSIGRTAKDADKWWQDLNAWSGPTGTRASLESLAHRGTIVVAASPAYLRPLEHQISDLDPERVLVISAGAGKRFLSGHLMPATGRLRLVLGGSMVSVNVRLAHHLMSKFGSSLSRQHALSEISELLERAPELPIHDRRLLNDREVLAEIARMRRASPDISATSAHRTLRSEGFACEQKRFRDLFHLPDLPLPDEESA